MKYVDLIYDWIPTTSNDMENIVMMSWHFLYLINWIIYFIIKKMGPIYVLNIGDL